MWGGSDIKYKKRPSVAYGFTTLWIYVLQAGSCNRNSRLLAANPSQVKHKTFKPHSSKRLIASHNGSYIWSPVKAVHGNCAYGKFSLVNKPLTNITSIELARGRGWLSSFLLAFSNASKCVFTSPRLVKLIMAPIKIL